MLARLPQADMDTPMLICQTSLAVTLASTRPLLVNCGFKGQVPVTFVESRAFSLKSIVKNISLVQNMVAAHACL